MTPDKLAPFCDQKYHSAQADTEGPPNTVTFPRRCARSLTSLIVSRWTCMPEANTASAHWKSVSVAGDMFSSTKRTSRFGGIDAAIRRSPCGGMKARTRPKSG
jgi:hypothetical protein